MNNKEFMQKFNYHRPLPSKGKNRFPEKFCFRLTKDEFEFMWSQIVTTSKLKDNKYRSVKYLPYVFTEQGIAMLSGKIKIEIFKPRLLKK